MSSVVKIFELLGNTMVLQLYTRDVHAWHGYDYFHLPTSFQLSQLHSTGWYSYSPFVLAIYVQLPCLKQDSSLVGGRLDISYMELLLPRQLARMLQSTPQRYHSCTLAFRYIQLVAIAISTVLFQIHTATYIATPQILEIVSYNQLRSYSRAAGDLFTQLAIAIVYPLCYRPVMTIRNQLYSQLFTYSQVIRVLATVTAITRYHDYN